MLGHFSEDVVITSPVAARVFSGSDGLSAAGRTAGYWREGLRRIPDLRFEVVGVYLGVATLVINYRNQAGGLVNEVLTFDGPLVSQAHGTYLAGVRPG